MTEGLGGLPPGIFRVSNGVADPGIDGRGRERESGGLAPHVYVELVMQWRIQELTKGERERRVWGLAPQVYLELVMQWRIQELTEGGREREVCGACPPEAEA